MPSQPLNLFSNVVNELELHPKLKILLLHSLEGKKPPEDVFDAISYGYFVAHIRPRLRDVLKNRPVVIRSRHDWYDNVIRFVRIPSLVVYVSPSYLIYEFVDLTSECYDVNLKNCVERGRWHRYYMFGVDNDGRIFVNRVNGAPDIYERELQLADNIKLRWVSDVAMRGVLGYTVDFGDREEVVVDFPSNPAQHVDVRVQGDIVLTVEPLTALPRYAGQANMNGHVELLLADVIARILLEHNISWNAGHNRNEFFILYTAPRKKDAQYLDKVAGLVTRELGELLGDVEAVKDNEYNGRYVVKIKAGDFAGSEVYISAWRSRRSGGDGRIEIAVFATGSRLTATMWREMLNAIESMPFTSMEFSIGNHHVKISNTKPLSFIYRPSRQPVMLNENIITIVNPLTFIVTPNTTIELYHREHGIKTVKFKDSYIITFRHVYTNIDYATERNSVVIERLEP
jgi:hypothetical protein